MAGRLDGRRVLVTSADRYGGPPVVELFRKEGAEVVADDSDYLDPEVPRRVVANSGRVDVLVANFAGPLEIMPFTEMLGPVQDTPEQHLHDYLNELLWPMVRFVQAVLPQMIERRSGKIVGITSASALRAIPQLAVYSAARGAQNAFIKCVGAEVAPHNVQVNAIAPAFFRNNTYFTPEMLADAETHDQIVANIPAGRMGEGVEAAEAALALAGDASNFFAGQIIAFSGGWAT